jgi:hypothetical protein
MAVPTARAQGAQSTSDGGELSALGRRGVSHISRALGGGNRAVSGLVLALVLLAGGCASAAAAVNISRATAAVEAARESGAGAENEYEMTLAKAYLDKAREESSEAEYLDAVHYAKYARSFAERAIIRSRERAVAAQNRGEAP